MDEPFEAVCPGCEKKEAFDHAAEAILSGWSVGISSGLPVCRECRGIVERVCDAKLSPLEPPGSPYPDLHAPLGGDIWCYRRRAPHAEED